MAKQVKVWDGSQWVEIGVSVADVSSVQQLLGPNTNIVSPTETWSVVNSAATGTINLDAITASAWYYQQNASNNFTLNFRTSSTVTLNSILSVGESISFSFFNTNGGTAYYANAFQIDGSSVTPKWIGGTAPTAGNTNAIDIYSFTIIKTAATPTYTVFANMVKSV